MQRPCFVKSLPTLLATLFHFPTIASNKRAGAPDQTGVRGWWKGNVQNPLPAPRSSKSEREPRPSWTRPGNFSGEVTPNPSPLSHSVEFRVLSAPTCKIQKELLGCVAAPQSPRASSQVRTLGWSRLTRAGATPSFTPARHLSRLIAKVLEFPEVHRPQLSGLRHGQPFQPISQMLKASIRSFWLPSGGLCIEEHFRSQEKLLEFLSVPTIAPPILQTFTFTQNLRECLSEFPLAQPAFRSTSGLWLS